MNLILEHSDQMRWYTDMRLVFSALPGVCEAHDWLISDIDCNWFPDDRIAYGNDPVLISGEALLEVVNAHDIQFNWAVFSALPRGFRPATSETPYADGNPEFWNGSPRPQLKEALFEIVCWDSTSTLLIGVPGDIIRQFRLHFTDSRDLDVENRKRSQSGSRGFFSPSPHNTKHAGPHLAFPKGYRAVAG
jgi:hypothetical protein